MNKFKLSLLAVLAASVVGCGGGGGSSADSSGTTGEDVKISDNLSLSSYENKMAAISAIGPISFQNTFGSGLATKFLNSNSLAYGDFFGDGKYALVEHSFEYDWTAATADKIGQIYFYQQIDGKWVDKTSELIADTVGCLHSRKAIVADFNQDERPDVFFACSGIDQNPFGGEPSLLLTSNAQGKYTKSFLSSDTLTYTHGASAADINGDGYPDIAITDLGCGSNRGGIGFFVNNQDGTFTFNKSLLPAIELCKNAFTAELIKFPGRNAYDLFLSGHGSTPEYDLVPQVVINDGDGNFSTTSILPDIETYGLALDTIYYNGFLYLLRTIDTSPGFYSATAIQKIKYPEMTNSELIYTHSGNYSNGTAWVNWIGIHNGRIVAPNSDYGLSIMP